MLELWGSGGMPPQESFEKYMLKYCNLETFPHKMHISACRYLYTAFRYIWLSAAFANGKGWVGSDNHAST